MLPVRRNEGLITTFSALVLALSLASFGVNADRSSLAQPRFCSNPSATAWVAPRRPSLKNTQTRRHRLGHLSALPESDSLGKMRALLDKAKADAAEISRTVDEMRERQTLADLKANNEKKQMMAEAATRQSMERSAEASKAAKVKAAFKEAELAAASQAADEEAAALKAAEEEAAALKAAEEEAAALKAAEEEAVALKAAEEAAASQAAASQALEEASQALEEAAAASQAAEEAAVAEEAAAAAEEAAASKAAELAAAASKAAELVAAASKEAEEAAAAPKEVEDAAALQAVKLAERDERLKRAAESDALKDAEASAMNLTIPKLKAFIKSQGADLPSGSKIRKANYIEAALNAGRSNMEWADVNLALQESLETQGKGFSSK